jgi:outer membrane biosynthesis protein TonB
MGLERSWLSESLRSAKLNRNEVATMGAKKSKTKKKPAKAAPRAATTKKPKKAVKASPKKKTPAAKKKALPKARPAPKKAAPKPSRKASAPTPAKPKAPAAKPATAAPKPRAAGTRPTSKSLADRVRDCDAGTPVWFTVAGGIEHATVVRLGEDGAAVIRTDAGTIAVVSPSNLFETADAARAARSR